MIELSESDISMEEAAVGREISRVEGREKVTGQVLYAADFPMPGLLYAASRVDLSNLGKQSEGVRN